MNIGRKKRNRLWRVGGILLTGAVLLEVFLGRGANEWKKTEASESERVEENVDLVSTGSGAATMYTETIASEGSAALDTAADIIADFAREHDLSVNEWTEELVELLERNQEAREFVLNYPLKKDIVTTIDLGDYVDCDTVPIFLQWDERWGYTEYGDTVMGLSGCGPTCLSMVCVYLLGDTSYNPRYVADFSEENGYCVPGSGSSWTLISKGGKKLGLEVTEIPLDENRIIRNLKAGNPIICVMGPGNFTTTGHFIVLTGYEDGKIKVNDPNSIERSKMLWEYENIKNQIRNLWVCRKG